MISIATVYRSSRPGSSPKRLHTFRSQVRCCEPGLRRYPTIFGFRRSVSSGRRASGSTQKTLFALPGISKAIGASDIAIRRQSAGTIAAQVFTPSRLPDAGIVAVGRPVDGVEVCIKDETGALVPPGEIGEIVVRSRFLAQGYWNNPDLTAKVFQTDPLDSAIRIYRTGDLGRWRSDGTLEHVGRKGRRIRLRGYNVEPFQVECELMRQPGVTDAVVLLHDGAAGQEPCLVGYVVAPANASPSAMRKGLAERLPSYMVPSHIVVLDSFPIASSGKIDRKALPPPEGRSPELEGSYVAPRTPTEEVLASIWREVLKLEQVGVHDNFFELGGHSLLATQVVARLAKLLKLDLPLRRFFETADRIRSRGRAAEDAGRG